ncbi:MAG: SusC/RagA family TonB-linked outer membrane protein, partial [Maribacter sp.]
MKKLFLKRPLPKARSFLLFFLCFAIGMTSISAEIGIDKNSSSLEEIQSTITGIVNDENGAPLPGASVILKGTTNGTQTDFDGNFTIDAPSDGTLIISYIGYKSIEVAISGQSNIVAGLEVDASQLEEVVVVGYGTQQKKDVTGSLSQVEGKALTIAPPPNLSAALSGQLSGVIAIQSTGQPGFDNAAFQIRGRSTTGNNSPLILVDGVERPFQRVNPFEVASVTALKDAASTAVYGSRAANGVLLVTTKRGKVGKPSFNFSSTIGFQSPAGRPELMSASEYVLAFRQAFRNDGTAEVDLPLGDLVSAAENGTVENFDWWGELLGSSAPQEQHNFSVNGGNDKLRYFFSYGLLDQGALFENAGFRQSSIRSNVDANITKGLTFSLNLAGRLENTLRSSDGDGEIFSNALRANPLLPVYVNDRPGGENLPPNSLGFDGFSGNAIGDANRNGSRTIDRDYFQS